MFRRPDGRRYRLRVVHTERRRHPHDPRNLLGDAGRRSRSSQDREPRGHQAFRRDPGGRRRHHGRPR